MTTEFSLLKSRYEALSARYLSVRSEAIGKYKYMHANIPIPAPEYLLMGDVDRDIIGYYSIPHAHL